MIPNLRSRPPHAICLAAILVMSLPASGQTPLWTVAGPDSQEQMGSALADAGDVDGDGVTDVVVGSPKHWPPVDSGAVRILSGATGAVITAWFEPLGYLHLGTSVAGPGDLDGDGTPDVASGMIGAAAASFAGRVKAISGATGLVLWSVDGTVPDARLGTSLAALGDQDLDGVVDLVAGAPFEDYSIKPGSARVLSGATGAVLGVVSAPSGANWFGAAVGAVGDLDQDGRPDFAVGAPMSENQRGRAVGYSGATLSALFDRSGLAHYDHFGSSIAGGADWTGDGRSDIAIGAPGGDSQFFQEAGSASVYSLFPMTLFWKFQSDVGYARLGTSLAVIDDRDGDGRPELITGAPGYQSSVPGKAMLLAGATGMPIGLVNGEFEESGKAVAGLGDLDGDGVGDFAVGSPTFKTGEFNSGGRVRAFGPTPCEGGATPYGAGCPVASGGVPFLMIEGCLEPGGAVKLVLTHPPASGLVLFAIGTGSGSIPIAGGCNALVAPIVAVLPLQSASFWNGIPITIPLSAALGSFRMQAIFQAENKTPPVAVSNGLLVSIL